METPKSFEMLQRVSFALTVYITDAVAGGIKDKNNAIIEKNIIFFFNKKTPLPKYLLP